MAASKPAGGKYTSKTAKTRAKSTAARTLKPPTWKRAVIQGVVLAGLYFVIIWVWQKGGGLNLWGAILIAVVGFIIFTLMAYSIDRFTYNRRRRKIEGPGSGK